MSITSAIRSRAAETASNKKVPLVRGRSFPIRLLPDRLTGDRITIGVGFIDEAGVTHCRIATDFSKLACLYGDRVDVDSFLMLRDAVEADLNGTAWVESRERVSDNIEFGQAFAAAGYGVTEILERSYGALVRFGTPKDIPASQRPIATDKLVRDVRAQLLHRDYEQFRDLFSGMPIRLSRDFGTHQIKLPLNDPRNGQAGDIVSAWSSNVDTVSRHMLMSMRNLISVKSAADQRDVRAFVLRPHLVLEQPSRDAERISEEIDFTSRVLQSQQIPVVAAASVPEMVDAIADWRRAA